MKFENKLITPQFTKEDVSKILETRGIRTTKIRAVKQYNKNELQIKYIDGKVITLYL